MKFTFGVITYNHEKYIAEHLESIKYQIERYGNGMSFQLVVADDGSGDNTINIVNYWIEQNKGLFFDVIVLSDGKNRGTCYNYTGIWQHITGEYCKITAGDDVYSCLSMFASLKELDSNHIVSGIPLLLIDGIIHCDREYLFHIAATEIIFKNKDYLERQKKVSAANTPNMFIARHVFNNPAVFDFVRKFSVTEDLPLHIKMAEEYSPLKSFQSNDVIVYYRRTSNSTYLIKNNAFNQDKINLYSYLIDREKRTVNRVLLRNRVLCFKISNKILAIICNLNNYVYFFELLTHIVAIARLFKKFDTNIGIHEKHQEYINQQANDFLKNQCDFNLP